MSTAGSFSRLCLRLSLSIAAVALLLASPSRAQEPALSPEPLGPSLHQDWTTDDSLEDIKIQADEISQLLDDAKARVDQLAGKTSGQAASRALIAAIRQELDLSRQWNSHLTSILIEVAKERQELAAREQKAAAHIYELTSAVEEARLELISLWNSLRPGHELPVDDIDLPAHHDTPTDQSSADVTDETITSPAFRQPRSSDTMIDEAQQMLDDMDAAQKVATGDIEALRAKLIDALKTLQPHKAMPHDEEIEHDRHVEGSLSSRMITAWAASITTKLHHEGFHDLKEARKSLETVESPTPNVTSLMMQREALSTAAILMAPHHQATPIATVPAGGLILVTGKVVDQDWYRVRTEDGLDGFISGDLIKHQTGPMTTGWHMKPS